MNHKLRMWLAFASIVILCCIDYAYFTEGLGAIYMDDRTRKLAHLAILLGIIPVGYWGWQRHPLTWLKKVWLWSHLLSLSTLVIAGGLCYLAGFYNEAFLKKIGDIRLFFCSPVPFFVLNILSVISPHLPDAVKK